MKNLAAVAITQCVEGAGASPQGGRAQAAVRIALKHSVKEVARGVVLIADVLILVMPRLLNLVVAIYLIIVGLMALNAIYHWVQ
jgi:hypothetical protein